MDLAFLHLLNSSIDQTIAQNDTISFSKIHIDVKIMPNKRRVHRGIIQHFVYLHWNLFYFPLQIFSCLE